jgi:hypothetical protein
LYVFHNDFPVATNRKSKSQSQAGNNHKLLTTQSKFRRQNNSDAVTRIGSKLPGSVLISKTGWDKVV